MKVATAVEIITELVHSKENAVGIHPLGAVHMANKGQMWSNMA